MSLEAMLFKLDQLHSNNILEIHQDTEDILDTDTISIGNMFIRALIPYYF